MQISEAKPQRDGNPKGLKKNASFFLQAVSIGKLQNCLNNLWENDEAKSAEETSWFYAKKCIKNQIISC